MKAGAHVVVLSILGVSAFHLGSAPAGAADPPQLVAVKAAKPPALDGRGDDAVWREAKPVTVVAKGVMPKTLGTTARVSLRAAYTDTHLYLLAVWDDATQDDKSHRSWKWDADKKAYGEDTDREDMFGVAFEHTGEFTADMLAPVEGVWDVWHWKAFRTNPQGYAMDKTHRYSRSQPAGRANKHAAKDGTDIWIARPEDAGDTVEKSQPAPAELKGERVARYLPGTPSGSAADVQAKGAWAKGQWTVEFARRLETGQPDDTAFSPSRTYRMAVSVHDRSGEMDKASEAVVLSFGR
jgi:hypothetical protein